MVHAKTLTNTLTEPAHYIRGWVAEQGAELVLCENVRVSNLSTESIVLHTIIQSPGLLPCTEYAPPMLSRVAAPGDAFSDSVYMRWT